MQSKQLAVQIYVHLRRFLTPEESINIVKQKVENCHISIENVEQLEQIRKTKLMNARLNGSLDKYYYTY